MIRTILAIAAIVAAAASMVPQAQACISCEYKPEVLGKSETSARVQKRVRVDAVVKSRKARASKERVVTRKAPGKGPVHAEKTPSTDEKKTTASEAGGDAATPRAQSVYNTLLKTTEPAAEKPAAATPSATAPTATVNGNSDASAEPVASADSAPVAAAKDETSETAPTAAEATETVTVSQQKGDKTKGCKKFFPMADITLTVACE